METHKRDGGDREPTSTVDTEQRLVIVYRLYRCHYRTVRIPNECIIPFQLPCGYGTKGTNVIHSEVRSSDLHF